MSDFNTSTWDRLAILTDLYIAETITQKEAAELLWLIESNSEFREYYCLNVLCDFSLCKKREIIQGEPVRPKIPSSEENQLVPYNMEDWDELIRIDREAVRRWQLQNQKNELSEQPRRKNRVTALLHELAFWRKENRDSIIPVVMAICVFFLIVWIILFSLDQTTTTIATDMEETDTPDYVVRVRELINPVWSEEGVPYKRGQQFNEGNIDMESGTVLLEFVNGTELLLEGKVKFVVNDAMRTFCYFGKVSATVSPEAHGFEIRTPFGNIIDRGTEFFLDVQKENFEVETVKGLIEVSSRGLPSIPIPVGVGSQVTRSGKHKTFRPPQFRFTTPEIFHARLTEYTKQEKSITLRESQQLDRNPHIIARFNMSGESMQSVKNSSLAGQSLCSDLELVRCEQTEGPLFDTNAVLFAKKNSYAQLHFDQLPESSKILTLTTRVRIDQFGKGGNVLFSAGNYPNEENSLCWQVAINGESALYIGRGFGKVPETFIGQARLDKKDRGTWVNLALVLDSQAKKISHYVDGNLAGICEWNNPIPLQFQDITIGNLATGSNHDISRVLNGAMCEFTIYNSKPTFKHKK